MTNHLSDTDGQEVIQLQGYSPQLLAAEAERAFCLPSGPGSSLFRKFMVASRAVMQPASITTIKAAPIIEIEISQYKGLLTFEKDKKSFSMGLPIMILMIP
jgi:hypothetical protein